MYDILSANYCKLSSILFWWFCWIWVDDELALRWEQNYPDELLDSDPLIFYRNFKSV